MGAKVRALSQFYSKTKQQTPKYLFAKGNFYLGKKKKWLDSTKLIILMFGIFMCHDCSRLRSCICAFIAKPFKNGLGSKPVFLYALLLCCSA